MNTKCPKCGHEDAYLGAGIWVECVNLSCPNFSDKWFQEVFETYAKKAQNSLKLEEKDEQQSTDSLGLDQALNDLFGPGGALMPQNPWHSKQRP